MKIIRRSKRGINSLGVRLRREEAKGWYKSQDVQKDKPSDMEVGNAQGRD